MMRKTAFVGVLMGALLIAGSCWANEPGAEKKPLGAFPKMMAGGPQFAKSDKPMPLPPQMRRPVLTTAQVIEKLSKDYGYSPEELKPFVKNGADLWKMTSSCYLARLSGEPLARVVDLSSKMTSGRVRYLLGLTPKVYFEKQTAFEAADLAKSLKLPEEKILQLLRSNYSVGEVKMAAALGAQAHKTAKQVLKLKTAANTWEMVAGKLNIDRMDFEKLENELKLPSDGPRRSAVGFAGLHMRNPSKAYMLSILNNDYGFSVDELSPLFDRYGFQQLEQFCLYAHFAEVPLAKVIPLREKYTWEGMKLALGLNAAKYTEAAIQFHARRLQERQNIPAKITVKLMRKGYALHHINTAYKYSLKCNKDIEAIIALKAPGKRWDEVAKECGISQEYADSIKKSITNTMGRYGQ